jgi:ABC-type branched-subunit amino acid transport system substrate-binding protein
MIGWAGELFVNRLALRYLENYVYVFGNASSAWGHERSMRRRHHYERSPSMTPRRYKSNWSRAIAIAAGLSLVAAACGGDDDETTSTTTAGTTAGTSAAVTTAPGATETTVGDATDTTESTESTDEASATTVADSPATTAAEAEEPAPAPTGDPIVLSVIGQGSGPIAQPEVYTGAEVAVAAINAAGGVTVPGQDVASPLEVLSCDGASTIDPNAPLQCARDAVEAGAVASVGKYSSGDDIFTEFESVSLPVIGNLAIGAGDLFNELSFPLLTSGVGAVAGLAKIAQDNGATTVALVTNDVPSGRAVVPLLLPGLNDPADLVAEVYLPLDPSSDITSFIAQATSADAILSLNSAGGQVRVINALAQAGYTGAIGVNASTLTEDTIDQIGAAADQVFAVSGFESVNSVDNPVIAQFREEMELYAPEAAVSEFSLNSWLAVYYAAGIIADVGTDRAAITAAANGREASLGVAPDFTLTQIPNPLNIPRVFRATIQEQHIEDGELLANEPGAFVDALAP